MSSQCFTSPKIQEVKEAFNTIDQNCGRFIGKEDLNDMLTSLGKNPWMATWREWLVRHQDL